MDFKKGYIYELDEDWGLVRLLEMFQEYEQFDPDKCGDKFVKLVKIKPNSESNLSNTPFRMKKEMFADLVIETHGHTVDEN